MVLSLEGDLGCGKTVFVQGLAEGLSVPEEIYVTSPSYALIHEYPGTDPSFLMWICTVSKTPTASMISAFSISWTKKSVVAIEWAERVQGALPPEGMIIRFKMVTDDTRKISLTAYGLQAANVLRTLRE